TKLGHRRCQASAGGVPPRAAAPHSAHLPRYSRARGIAPCFPPGKLPHRTQVQWPRSSLREGRMSVAKLLPSRLLSSSGLILAAFTLHGGCAAQWQVQATVPAEYGREPPLAVVQERRAAGETAPDSWTAQLVRTENAPGGPESGVAKAKKRLLEKKL